MKPTRNDGIPAQQARDEHEKQRQEKKARRSADRRTEEASTRAGSDQPDTEPQAREDYGSVT